MSGKKQFEPRKVADRPEVKRRVCELAVAAGIWSDPDDKSARLFRKLDDAERAAKKSKLDLLLPPIEDIFRVTHRQDRTTGAARLAGTIVEALCTASKGDELRVREALKAIGWLRTRLRFLVASYDPENAWDAVIIELANIWFDEARNKNISAPRPGPDQYGTLAESPFVEFAHLVLADLYDGKNEPEEICAERLAYRWRRLKSSQRAG